MLIMNIYDNYDYKAMEGVAKEDFVHVQMSADRSVCGTNQSAGTNPVFFLENNKHLPQQQNTFTDQKGCNTIHLLGYLIY